MTSPQLDLKTQIIRFVAIGIFSGIVDFGLTYLLGAGLGFEEFYAKTIGFIAGTTTAYLLNRRLTFRAEPSTKRLLAVWALYLVTFGVQAGIFLLVLHLWPSDAFVHWFVAYVLAQGTATVINFVVQRLVIFRLAGPS